MDYKIKTKVEDIVKRWEESYGVYANLNEESRKMLIREIASEMERYWVKGLNEGRQEKEKWGFPDTPKRIFNGG